MTSPEALALATRLTTLLAAVASLTQALELLAIRRELGAQGFWSWEILRRDYRGWPLPLRRALDGVLGQPGFTGVLGAQAAAALALATLGVWAAPGASGGWAAPEGTTLALLLALIGATLLTGLRWRGTFNGGSDSMTLGILLGLAVAHLPAGTAQPAFQRAGLLWIGALAGLSYLLAGAYKLARPEWRSGVALGRSLANPRYVASGTGAERLPRLRDAFARSPALGRIAAWSVIGFEIAFPFAVMQPGWSACVLTLGLAFHLAIARELGLNRFLLAWPVAYPALWLLAHRA